MFTFSGTISESLSNDSVMILFKNDSDNGVQSESPLSTGMATNVEPELTSQSFFIPGNMNVTSLKSDMDNITALDTFQLDANGQIIPLYT